MSRSRLSAARICDGSGRPLFSGHVVIDDDRISDVVRSGPAGQLPGELGDVPELVECPPGAIVAPGLVDLHSHSDLSLVDSPGAVSKLAQGVTTEVVGNCGFSAFPAPGYWLEPVEKYRPEGRGWSSAREYLDHLARRSPVSSVATLVGTGSVRAAAGVTDGIDVDGAVLAAMRDHVRAAVAQGAVGVSSGLFYRPGCYATLDETVMLVSEAVRGGARFYATHMRDEATGLLPSILESLETARRSDAHLHISHLKAKGRRSWGTLEYAIECIDRSGVDVTVDVYPYEASMSSIDSLVPRPALAGLRDTLGAETRRSVVAAIGQAALEREGTPRWGDVVIVYSPTDRSLERHTIEEVAAQRGIEPAEAVLDLCLDSQGKAEIINYCMNPDEIDQVVALPYAAVVSDGYALSANGGHGHPHPRSFGAFPRFIRHYAVDRQILTIEEAIRKVTSLPAELVGLEDVGRIAPGARADVIVLEPEKLEDRATYDEPRRTPVGVASVVVGGQVMTLDADPIPARNGRILRRTT